MEYRPAWIRSGDDVGAILRFGVVVEGVARSQGEAGAATSESVEMREKCEKKMQFEFGGLVRCECIVALE